MAHIGLDLRQWRSLNGGIGRYSRNLLVELLKLDQSNQYTAIIRPHDEPEFQLEAPNLHKLVVEIPHFSVAEQRTLPAILNQHNFDLVHFASFNHPLLYRRPFVVTIHDMILHFFPGSVQRKSFIRRSAYRLAFNDCRRAETIIVPSQATKNDLVEKLGFPERKIVVTEEGSEGIFHPISSRAKKEIKRKFNLPERYLIFVSRWEGYKGLPVLIEAYQKLSHEWPDLGLVICGKPDKGSPEIAELVKQAQSENHKIITPGFVSDEDLINLYGAATVYVHPSRYEGFGIMVLEAFASGVPVVTSNVSSLPEVVGDAGLLANPLSADEVAQAIKKILTDPKLAESLVKKGLERAQQFSWQKMAEQTLAVYQDALK